MKLISALLWEIDSGNRVNLRVGERLVWPGAYHNPEERPLRILHEP